MTLPIFFAEACFLLLSGLQFCRDEYAPGAVPTVARQLHPRRELYRWRPTCHNDRCSSSSVLAIPGPVGFQGMRL